MKSSIITAIQDEGRAQQAEEWLLRLPQLLPADLPDQGKIEDAVSALSHPAGSGWILARVASLLLPYYEKDTPQVIREMEAEDWLESLSGIPVWAIDLAVRWWKGPDNPDRRRRPLEGDISSRAKMHFGNVRAVPAIVGKIRVAQKPTPEPPKTVTPEEMAERKRKAEEIMAGFRRKAD